MSYPIFIIAKVIQAKVVLPLSKVIIDDILTDSRKLLIPSSTLFFALPGQGRQGTQFINNLILKGVQNFVVHHSYNIPKNIRNINFLVVDDVLLALQTLATYHRLQFTIPIIGITGSNGKTIVKEWLYQLLSTTENIVRSPKSYNSQIGVPISVWGINKANTLGIFEAGISLPNEMDKLQNIIKPTIGIITFIGSAHAQGFKNIQAKIKQKLLLFVKSNVLIYCIDDALVNKEILQFAKVKNRNIQLFTWGKSTLATLQIKSVQPQIQQTIVTCIYKKNKFSFALPFTDEASINNAITCASTLLAMNYAIEHILIHIPKLTQVAMRMELKQGINNTLIINDGYSVDMHSLNIAIQFLQQQKQYAKHTLILSDVLQSATEEAKLYKNISTLLATKNLNTLIAIGEKIFNHAHQFKSIKHTYFYKNTAHFLKNFELHTFKEEVILLKGARVFQFENISKLLQQKTHDTRLEINLNAIQHNLKIYKSLLKPNTKIMVMVKAFGYGSGSIEVASVLQQAAIHYLAVAYVDEGVALRQAGITIPIMVLNTDNASFQNLIKYNLEPELYSLKMFEHLMYYLKQKKISQYPVHIKIDTGMKRLGFEPHQIDELCLLLYNNKHIKIASVFSHLAGSDVANFDQFTSTQQSIFNATATKIENTIGYSFIKHIANTAAIHRHSHLQLDMVRLGIGLYGIDASKNIQQLLQPVSTLKTTIAQIKHLKKGETIGYSRAGVATKNITTATVRIGYADGYPRILSNGKGKMYINGKSAPVIGNVCMDMTMLNVTGIQVQEGDEVIVFGQIPTVVELAKDANTIPYEILTNISQRVKRIYFEE